MVLLIFLLCWCSAWAQTVAIFTAKVDGATPWDPDTIKTGITGSEEAVIYMSKELAELGYQVTVFGDPPASSKYSLPTSNPCFLPMEKIGGQFDIAIAWRMPAVAEELKKYGKWVYLWPHDVSIFKLTEKQISTFNGVLWLSKWQRNQWISQNPSFSKFTSIFGNGISPQQFQTIESRANPYSCIYASNYARGLEVLLDCWPAVKRIFPRATLDVYYGWQHWGLLSPEKEAKLRKQVHTLASLGVVHHGLVGHEELNRAFAKASFWVYPCTLPETFCITALRAQSSGAIPVIIEGSALTETVRFGYKCSKPEEYLWTLLQALRNAEKISLEERKKMREFIFKEFTWKHLAQKWKEQFDIIESNLVE